MDKCGLKKMREWGGGGIKKKKWKVWRGPVKSTFRISKDDEKYILPVSRDWFCRGVKEEVGEPSILDQAGDTSRFGVFISVSLDSGLLSS